MATINKIQLTEEKETLFITLLAKAFDYTSKHPILNDKAADDLVRKIDPIGFDKTKYEGFGNIVTLIRAKQFDEWTKNFISEHPKAVVVYLGCGLDTRISRIRPSQRVNWFDVDYPEVIRFRKSFYTDRNGYKMILASVTDSGWLSEIPSDRQTLIIAEGILEYLSKEDVRNLLNRLTDYFPMGEIIFDVMNSFAINSGKEKLKKTTGAVHKWAVETAKEVDALNSKLIRLNDLPVFKSASIKKLPIGQRIILKVVCFFPYFRNMMQLMRYRF